MSTVLHLSSLLASLAAVAFLVIGLVMGVRWLLERDRRHSDEP